MGKKASFCRLIIIKSYHLSSERVLYSLLKFPTFAKIIRDIHHFMIIIKVKETENIDRALRRYKKKFEKTGILKQVRQRMFYKKPSEERKEMKKKAVNRQRHYANEFY